MVQPEYRWNRAADGPNNDRVRMQKCQRQQSELGGADVGGNVPIAKIHGGLDLGFDFRFDLGDRGGNLRGVGLGCGKQRGAFALSAAIAHDEPEPERHDGDNDVNEHVKNSYV
jgi:hypothetical protein